MKPMIILPPELMDAANIKQLQDNDICVVVASDPARVRFVDPIPSMSSRTQMEDAAIQLSRRLLNGEFDGSTVRKSDFARLYVEILIKGSPLDIRGSTEEQRKRAFDQEKEAELYRLAREEAKAEREAKKKAAMVKK